MPWLDNHHGNLSVLVHGSTGDALADHTINAYRLGDAVELDLHGF
ncbi:DOPA 4,5-dioxygenase family protein [Vibrio sp. VB16]|nr:DOPA 4,5-dioxygenase family protein [Vibrio sp. VB16]UGA56377.1 DOPA 4,5-dioxygenase family protein [Vibrio sp. VB16]